MKQVIDLPLSDIVGLTTKPVRSASVELSASSDVEAYIPTGRALDVIDRWTRAMVGSSRTRAWSITGPYGSGKSSLAVFLSALASPAESPARVGAERKLQQSDPELHGRLGHARTVVGADATCFVRCVATADHCPLVATLARALLHGVLARPADDGTSKIEGRLRPLT